jgi:class 3 adenylate cyclase
VWGDTVNTASRMQSHGIPGQIQVSEATYELIKADFICEPRGIINVKGKGDMNVWLVVSEREKQVI